MLENVLSFLLGHVVFALMLSTGLSSRPRELADIVRRPALYARAMLVMWIAVPLLAIATIALLRLPRRPAELMVIMSICPGAPVIPDATKRSSETHSTVGLNLLLLASLLAPLLTPAWMALLARVYAVEVGIISPLQVLGAIAPRVLLPLALGLLVRRYAPRAADVLARPVHYFFLAALVVAGAMAFRLGGPVFEDISPRTGVAAFVMVIGASLMGYAAAANLGGERRTVGIAAALGNPVLALAVIANSHPGFQAAALMLAYVILRTIALVPFLQWVHTRQLREQPHEPVWVAVFPTRRRHIVMARPQRAPAGVHRNVPHRRVHRPRH
ncbi:MAG: hypothetical protein HOW73_14815 [Polyangiaceae bacterium]|nr:hypothetical protein [Polyangiaceae bacterium]